MSRNAWTFLIVFLLAGAWFLGGSIISARVLADMANRPIVELAKGEGADALRIPVASPGGPRKPGDAYGLGGRGTLLGFDIDFALPDGGRLTCHHRLTGVTCDEGWLPVLKGDQD